MNYFIFSMNYFIFSIKYFIEFMYFLRSESLKKSRKISENLGKSRKVSTHGHALLKPVSFYRNLIGKLKADLYPNRDCLLMNTFISTLNPILYHVCRQVGEAVRNFLSFYTEFLPRFCVFFFIPSEKKNLPKSHFSFL